MGRPPRESDGEGESEGEAEVMEVADAGDNGSLLPKLLPPRIAAEDNDVGRRDERELGRSAGDW